MVSKDTEPQMAYRGISGHEPQRDGSPHRRNSHLQGMDGNTRLDNTTEHDGGLDINQKKQGLKKVRANSLSVGKGDLGKSNPFFLFLS
jgi:hypothetical protein